MKVGQNERMIERVKDRKKEDKKNKRMIGRKREMKARARECVCVCLGGLERASEKERIKVR